MHTESCTLCSTLNPVRECFGKERKKKVLNDVKGNSSVERKIDRGRTISFRKVLNDAGRKFLSIKKGRSRPKYFFYGALNNVRGNSST